VKISESPHEISDENIANAATNATAPRALFGIDASHDVSRATGGDDATTKPPMITIAICIVKFTSDQKPVPNSATSFVAGTPIPSPPKNTSTIAASANTKASGNQRSQKSAMRIPMRASMRAIVAGGCLVYACVMAKATQDHAEIRGWVAARGGLPAHKKGSSSPEILGVYFGPDDDETLADISWEQFFEVFDRRSLAMLLAEEPDSRWYKIIGQKKP